jgi:hypothetical protein
MELGRQTHNLGGKGNERMHSVRLPAHRGIPNSREVESESGQTGRDIV